MNGGDLVDLECQNSQRFSEHVLPERDVDFGPEEYNVQTGIDVSADGPGAAMLAAIKEMELRNPEAFCYHVEHLQSGKKWEVELYPSGEIEVEDWDT
ncbi:MAG: hypothetical protein ABSG60_10930 [Terracidiphilus sp.]|jgi:hypothetical protein